MQVWGKKKLYQRSFLDIISIVGNKQVLESNALKIEQFPDVFELLRFPL